MPLQITGRVTEEQVAMVMKTLDADNDGSVTFTEFSNALELVECVPPPLCLSVPLSLVFVHIHAFALKRTCAHAHMHAHTHASTHPHIRRHTQAHRHTCSNARW